MMFFYKGNANIVLNTDPVFHRKEYYPTEYDIDMNKQCIFRQGAWYRDQFNALLRESEPTGNCQRCWQKYPMPSQEHNAPLPWQMDGRPTDRL